jgi:hypothetical protein
MPERLGFSRAHPPLGLRTKQILSASAYHELQERRARWLDVSSVVSQNLIIMR